ncbi:MAG: S8 family serine peptidase [Nitrospirota bacterium]|nr:MAG: S8 family serine peptidase [Nitrospirota bacterium]
MRRKNLFILIIFFCLSGLLLFSSGSDSIVKDNTAGQLNQLFKNAGTGEQDVVKPYRDGEVIVKYRKGLTKKSIDKTASSRSMSVVSELKHLSQRKGQKYMLLRSDKKTTKELVKELSKDPDVEYAEPNYLLYASYTPNDARIADMWGLQAISAPLAWNIETGDSTPVVIADLDTGVDYLHEDLSANMWVNPGESVGDANSDGAPGILGVDDDGDGLIDEDSQGNEPGDIGYLNDLDDDDDENGYADDFYGIDAINGDTDPMDDFGHGTHTSGTIVATGDNALGVVGVSYGSRIMALKILGSSGIGDISAEAEAIEYLVDMKQNHGVNVVAANLSYSGAPFSQTQRESLQLANDAGIIVIAAAGNTGSNNDISKEYPCAHDLPNIICVAASNSSDQLASFSNYGLTTVDIAAPGVAILSTVFEADGNFAPGASAHFYEDFEPTVTGWTMDPPTSAFTSENPYEGSYAWSDSPSSNYSNLATTRLETVVNTSTLTNASLNYWAFKHLEEGFDFLNVSISMDGSTWTTLNSATGIDYYHNYDHDITSYISTNTYLRFELSSDLSIVGDGVYIDNVAIYDPANYGASIFDHNLYTFYSGTSMAAPHVSGAVGLISARYPAEGIGCRIKRIYSGADSVPGLSGTVSTGGRLNLLGALQYSISSLPDIMIMPSSIDFGNTLQGVPVTRTVNLVNSGNSGAANPLDVSSITITGADSSLFSVSTDTCASLTPSISDCDSCSIHVTFIPTSAGIKSADLVIGSDDPSNPTVTIPLSGSGVSLPSVPKKSGGGGCFIATAAYGSYMHKDVKVLREFRDRHLLTNAPGRIFVKAYYMYSPPVAEMISENDIARAVVRMALTPFIFVLKFPFVIGFAIVLPFLAFGVRKYV